MTSNEKIRAAERVVAESKEAFRHGFLGERAI